MLAKISSCVTQLYHDHIRITKESLSHTRMISEEEWKPGILLPLLRKRTNSRREKKTTRAPNQVLDDPPIPDLLSLPQLAGETDRCEVPASAMLLLLLLFPPSRMRSGGSSTSPGLFLSLLSSSNQKSGSPMHTSCYIAAFPRRHRFNPLTTNV